MNGVVLPPIKVDDIIKLLEFNGKLLPTYSGTLCKVLSIHEHALYVRLMDGVNAGIEGYIENWTYELNIKEWDQ